MSGHHHHHHGHHHHQEPPKFVPNPNQVYKIVTVKDVQKAFTISTIGDHLLTLDVYKGLNNQNFHIYLENGKYAFVSLFNNAALHVFHESKDDGGSIRGNPNKFPSNFFEIHDVQQGQWVGKAVHIRSFAGKDLDIYQNKLDNGNPIVQWTPHGQDNQTWLILPGEVQQQQNQGFQQNTQQQGFQQNTQQQGFQQNTQQQGQQGQGFGFNIGNVHVNLNLNQGFHPIPNKAYRIFPVAANGKTLDVSKNGADLNSLILWDWHGGINQQFIFEASQGKWHIRTAQGNLYLTVTNDGNGNGARIRADPPGKQSQLWDVVPAEGVYKGKGFFHLKTIYGKGLDVPAAKYQNEAHLEQYDFHAGENQTWSIQPI